METAGNTVSEIDPAGRLGRADGSVSGIRSSRRADTASARIGRIRQCRLFGSRVDQVWHSDWRAEGVPFWVVAGITVRGYEYDDGERDTFREPFVTDRDGEVNLS